MLVLVVDDNVIDRKVVARMVEGMGHQVVQNRHGLEALSSVETQQFDVIVLDLLMPLLNGLETIQQMRKLASCRETPIIVLSSAEAELSRHCLEAGACRFLSKPCLPTDLEASLRIA